MAIDDWCDVAWAYILDQSPMMANAHEYRETLWAILHDGEAPPKFETKTDAKGKTPRRGRGMTKTDRKQLEGFLGTIAQIQQSKTS